MAQAGYTPIQLYYSTTASAAPSSGNLANGELAINITDGKLYYKDNGGTVRVLAGTGGTGVVAGSNTQVQFNNNGVFGASSGLTWDGTNLTASQLRSSGLTSGRVTYAGASGLLVDSANMTFNGTRLTVADLADSGLTSGRVVYSTAGGALVDSANLLYSGTDLTVYGITVGRGAGAVSTNTAVGASALAANTSGIANVAVGYNALAANTTAAYNTVVGYNAAITNTTGTKNSVFGQSALYYNSTGSYNTAIGVEALVFNTTASNNTAVGYQAGYSNTTGANSVSIGYQAGYSNTTANDNVAIGVTALALNTTGTANTAVGRAALTNNTTTSNSTAVGYQALYSSTANNNTAVGFQAMSSTTTGGEVAFGAYALSSNTTGARNTAIGTAAGTTGTTAADNVFVGYHSAYAITTGSYNTAIGTQTLRLNTTASNNTAVGYQAGYSTTTGGVNAFFGDRAGYSATTGVGNTFIGQSAGYSVTTGVQNTFIGHNTDGSAAGSNVTTGSKNTILGGYNGNQGGLDIRTANNYIVLSDGDGNPRLMANGNGQWAMGMNPRTDWPSSWSVLNIQGNNNLWGVQGQLQLGYNNYYDGTNYRYGANGAASRLIQTDSGFYFDVATSGTAGATISFDTAMRTAYNATLALRGATPQSGTGITFPATQQASSDANTLDDYEEGTWTPTLIGSGGASGQSYNRQVGKYTKIGNVVYCSFDVQLTNRGTLSGIANIGGLPFTPSPPVGSTYMGEASIGYFTGLNTSYVSVSLTPPDGNVSQLIIRALTAAATASTDPQATDFFTNATRLIGGVWYFTSSQ